MPSAVSLLKILLEFKYYTFSVIECYRCCSQLLHQYLAIFQSFSLGSSFFHLFISYLENWYQVHVVNRCYHHSPVIVLHCISVYYTFNGLYKMEQVAHLEGTYSHYHNTWGTEVALIYPSCLWPAVWLFLEIERLFVHLDNSWSVCNATCHRMWCPQSVGKHYHRQLAIVLQYWWHPWKLLDKSSWRRYWYHHSSSVTDFDIMVFTKSPTTAF